MPIGIAGVMGGETTELSETTTDIVVEAAHFDPVTIFRDRQAAQAASEASKRFERGVDPTAPPAAADRVVELLVELGGGTVDPGVTVVGAGAGPRRTSASRLDLPARITGMDISAETPSRALQAVGCDGRRVDADEPDRHRCRPGVPT